jgi:tRNA pseudouridine55 synthase
MNLEEGYILNIDKPLGWTSADVVRKVKFGLQRGGWRKLKVGHAGTLDPLATGVLLVCLGRATKRVEELQGGRKEYVADVVFGGTTPSYDLEHEVDRVWPWEHITREMVEGALVSLSGERLQTPPVYSAKKIDGMRAYELAREGEQVEMKRALVNIYAMELLEWEPPRARVRVECSKGTYIRSLAMELGEAVGSGAHLGSLRRTRNGEYKADEGMTMEGVEEFLATNRKNMPVK